jgi:hypothetical protein
VKEGSGRGEKTGTLAERKSQGMEEGWSFFIKLEPRK